MVFTTDSILPHHSAASGCDWQWQSIITGGKILVSWCEWDEHCIYCSIKNQKVHLFKQTSLWKQTNFLVIEKGPWLGSCIYRDLVTCNSGLTSTFPLRFTLQPWSAFGLGLCHAHTDRWNDLFKISYYLTNPTHNCIESLQGVNGGAF